MRQPRALFGGRTGYIDTLAKTLARLAELQAVKQGVAVEKKATDVLWFYFGQKAWRLLGAALVMGRGRRLASQLETYLVSTVSGVGGRTRCRSSDSRSTEPWSSILASWHGRHAISGQTRPSPWPRPESPAAPASGPVTPEHRLVGC